MIDVLVEEVSKDRSRVALRVLNVRFEFVRKPGGGVRLVSKHKPEAQVYNPAACWVPKNLFYAVCQKAAAILKT